MQEIHAPALVEIDPATNIVDMLMKRLSDDPDSIAFERRTNGDWERVSIREFHEEALGVAKGLVASGINVGDRVAIMSRTRYEWSLLDFAIWIAGAVCVPVYETSSPDQVEWILTDSEVSAMFVENQDHLAVVESVKSKVPSLQQMWLIESDDISELTKKGRTVSDAQIDENNRSCTGETLATVIYTSGTTGRPKGVELTHGNFVSLCLNIAEQLKVVLTAEPEARTILFIPLAHVFARMIEVVAIPGRVVVGHSPDVKSLMADLESFKPTFILAVPRVFEKVYNSADQKAAAGGRLQLRIFRLGAAVAIGYSRMQQEKGRTSPWWNFKRALFDVLVYRKLRQALGGRTEWAISGGAPLGKRLGYFFAGIGLKVIEGYGLTETTAPSAANEPEHIRIGTVGGPVAGTSIRIADDGEILLHGPHIFRGYRNNPEATAEALQDGWFRTGDIGSLSDDGHLTITGRKKEIIVTAGGKNVSPAILEDRLRSHPLIQQCMVVGDQKPFIGALITLDPEMLPGWLSSHDKPAMTIASAAVDPDVYESLQRAVDKANRAVSRAESIRKFIILPDQFTEQNGYITPSLKLRRHLVLQDYAEVIEGLYGIPTPAKDRSIVSRLRRGNGNGNGNGNTAAN